MGRLGLVTAIWGVGMCAIVAVERADASTCTKPVVCWDGSCVYFSDQCPPEPPPDDGPSDGDGDGIPDGADNCPGTANAGQADSDGDGTGDACDSTPHGGSGGGGSGGGGSGGGAGGSDEFDGVVNSRGEIDDALDHADGNLDESDDYFDIPSSLDTAVPGAKGDLEDITDPADGSLSKVQNEADDLDSAVTAGEKALEEFDDPVGSADKLSESHVEITSVDVPALESAAGELALTAGIGGGGAVANHGAAADYIAAGVHYESVSGAAEEVAEAAAESREILATMTEGATAATDALVDTERTYAAERGGDPVALATGTFFTQETDLAVATPAQVLLRLPEELPGLGVLAARTPGADNSLAGAAAAAAGDATLIFRRYYNSSAGSGHAGGTVAIDGVTGAAGSTGTLGPGWRHSFQSRLFIGYDGVTAAEVRELQERSSRAATRVREARDTLEDARRSAASAVEGYRDSLELAEALAVGWRDLRDAALAAAEEGAELRRAAGEADEQVAPSHAASAEELVARADEIEASLAELDDRFSGLIRRADRAERNAESARSSYQAVIDFVDGLLVEWNSDQDARASATAGVTTALDQRDRAAEHEESLRNRVSSIADALAKVEDLGTDELDRVSALRDRTEHVLSVTGVFPDDPAAYAPYVRAQAGYREAVELRDGLLPTGLAAAEQRLRAIETEGPVIIGTMEESREVTEAVAEDAGNRSDYAVSAARRNGALPSGADPGATGMGTFTVIGADGAPRLFRTGAEPAFAGPTSIGDGLVHYYRRDVTAHPDAPGDYGRLIVRRDGSYILEERNGTEHRYDAYGRLTGVTARGGAAVTLEYEGLGEGGRLRRVVDDAGRTLALQYDRDRLVEVAGPDGAAVRYGYDGQGRLHSVTDPSGRTRHYRYRGHLLTFIGTPRHVAASAEAPSGGGAAAPDHADGPGRRYNYERRDGRDVVTWTEDEAGHRELFSYHPGESPYGAGYTKHTGYHDWTEAGAAVTTRTHYDTNLRTVRREWLNSDGVVAAWESFVHDAAGNVVRREAGGDGVRRVWRFAYDGDGNLVARIDPDGVEESWEYDADGNVTAHTNGAGETTRLTCDASGRLTGAHYPTGAAFRYRYDTEGNLTEIRRLLNGRWHATRLVYGRHGYPTSVEYPDGATAALRHDAYGRPAAHISRLGLATEDRRGPAGRLLERSYADGSAEVFRYDAAGNLTETKDRLGHVTRYEHDPRGLVTSVFRERIVDVETGANTVDARTYRYRADGRLAERRAGRREGGESAQWRYDYDYRGRLIREEETTTGTLTRYAYDAAGNLVERATEPTGVAPAGAGTGAAAGAGAGAAGVPATARTFVTKYGYSPAGRLEWTENGAGERTRFDRDGAGEVTAAIDPAGHRTRIRRDTAGRTILTTAVPGAPPEVRRFDEAGHLIELSDPDGSTWRYEYDPAGRIRRESAPDGGETTYTYRHLTPGMEVTRTDPLGNDWVLRFDAAGRRIGAVDPTGAETSFERDAAGRITTVIDAHGNRRSYVYDAVGNVLARMDAYGNGRTFTYDALGHPASVTLPTGETTRFGYDALGRRRWIEEPLGNRTHFTYDVAGNLLATETPMGLTRRFTYDAAGRAVARIEPDGATYRYEYDARGRTTGEIDPTGSVRRYEYEENARGNLIAEVNRLGARRTISYGAAGRIDSMTDFNGVLHDFDYDPAGRLIREVAEGEVVRAFEYDVRGDLVRAASPAAALEFDYDERGLLVESRDRDAEVAVAYEYDAAGRRTRVLTEGYEIATSYGAMGEVREVAFDDGSAFGAGEGRIRLEYDESLRERVRRFAGSLVAERHYDEAGRLAGVVHRGGGGVAGEVLDAEAYVYDRDGRRIYTVDEAGGLTAYRYDTAGRLAAALYPHEDGVVASHLRQLKAVGMVSPPAQADRLGTIGAATGSRGGSRGSSVAVAGRITIPSEERDLIREVTEQVLPRRKGGTFLSREMWGESFTYDERGNLTGVATPLGTIGFAYDAADRQVRAGALSVAYDAAGNVTRRAVGAAALEYDYDARHRMTRIHGRTPEGRDIDLRYGYDALDRRSYRLDVPSGDRTESATAGTGGPAATAAPGTATLERAVYQGFSFMRLATLEAHGVGSVQGDFSGVDAPSLPGRLPRPKPRRGAGPRSRVDAGQGAAVLTRLEMAAVAVSVQQVPAAVVSPRQVSHFGVDVLGSVTLRVTAHASAAGNRAAGSTGAIVEDLAYRAFGAVRAGDVRGAIPFGYTGKVVDVATAVYDYGLRDYAPSTGRFTTVDPLRAGTNWYAYVHNDPINLIDRFGLEASVPGNPGPGGFPLDPSVQVFRSDGNIDQLAFDQRYGFGTIAGTQSCQSVAVCNLYAQETPGGMTVEQLDVVVSVSLSSGHLEEEGGSVTDFSGLSRTIATELDRDDYYEYVYPAPDYERLTMSEHDFEQSDAAAGVVQLYNPQYDVNHFVTRSRDRTYDPLPSSRPTASGYVVEEVRPLQLLDLH